MGIGRVRLGRPCPLRSAVVLLVVMEVPPPPPPVLEPSMLVLLNPTGWANNDDMDGFIDDFTDDDDDDDDVDMDDEVPLYINSGGIWYPCLSLREP